MKVLKNIHSWRTYAQDIAELTLAERDEIQLFVLRDLRHAVGLFSTFENFMQRPDARTPVYNGFIYVFCPWKNNNFSKTTEQKPTHDAQTQKTTNRSVAQRTAYNISCISQFFQRTQGKPTSMVLSCQEGSECSGSPCSPAVGNQRSGDS